MRITLLTFGSRGDVQPFIALAAGLQQAGHQPLLAAPAHFASLVGEYGIPFAPLPGDPEELSLRLNDAHNNLLAMVSTMSEYVESVARPVWMAAKSACSGADLIVHSFLFTTGAHSLARGWDIPDVSVQLFPVFAPTRAFPMVAAPNLPPGALSYFTHWLGTQIFWQAGNAGFCRLRARDPQVFDLQLAWPFDTRRTSPARRTPLIFAYSPTLLPRPADWTNPDIHVTGFFSVDNVLNTPPELPSDLEAFLVAGEPPVCVSFGSMINRQAGQIYQVVRAALQSTHRRGVVLTGWGGSPQQGTDDGIFYLPAASHARLLPRCQAVVHHGGAGTTAAGLRAGIPNVILPHGGDQPFWAWLVARAGAGPKPLSLDKLSVERLAAALEQAASPALQAQAQRLGAALCAENGVSAAVQVIEAHTARYPRQE